MQVNSLYVLNKAGGLVYQRDFKLSLSKLTANDYLVLAGTIHGVHAIASKLKPLIGWTQAESSLLSGNNNTLLSTGRAQNPNSNNSGLQSIETDLFNLYIFQTLTGIKFLLITSPNPVVHDPMFHNNMHSQSNFNSQGELCKQSDAACEIFKHIYILYSDYVMKDPFYSLEMPIKSPLFDLKVTQYLS